MKPNVFLSLKLQSKRWKLYLKYTCVDAINDYKNRYNIFLNSTFVYTNFVKKRNKNKNIINITILNKYFSTRVF